MKEEEKNILRAQTTHLTSFGPVLAIATHLDVSVSLAVLVVIGYSSSSSSSCCVMMVVSSEKQKQMLVSYIKKKHEKKTYIWAQETMLLSLGPFSPLCSSRRCRYRVGRVFLSRGGLETRGGGCGWCWYQLNEPLLSQFEVRHHVMSDFELT